MRKKLRLSCESLEPRALLAWKVIDATSDTLLIGNPDDGDVGVLSYDPATNHYLLNGVDTGVAVTGDNGSPAVRATAGAAANATFVIDVSTPFPITGVHIPEYEAPGIHVEYDGGANVNHLRVVGGSVRVTPDSRYAGTLRVATGSANTVEYQNVRGSLHFVDATISVDARQDNGHQRWVLAEAGRVWIREFFPVEAACIDPPDCTQWIAPAVENTTEILDLTYAGGSLNSIYTGNGDDRVTIRLDGMSESSIGVKTGDGDDALIVIGSDQAERIELAPGPVGCVGFNGGGHWYNPAFPYEAGGCAISMVYLGEELDSTRIKYLEVERRTVKGFGGDDRIVGGPDNDYLDGGSGDDLINGRGGDDSIYGGYGDDTLVGEAGNDLLGGGDIIIVAGPGGCGVTPPGRCGFQAFGSSFDEESADLLNGGAGDDILLGTEGNNVLVGGPGNDILSGRDGDDSLNGGTGKNVIFAGRGADNVLSTGIDLVATGEFYFDFTLHVLSSILAEWTSPKLLSVRIENIKSGHGSGLSEEWALNATTHKADGSRDHVLSRRSVDFLLATSEDEVISPQGQRRPRIGLTPDRTRRRASRFIVSSN